MKRSKLVWLGVICSVVVLLAGCTGVSQSEHEALQEDYSALAKTSEIDRCWLVCELAWTEVAIADLEGTTDMAAERDFERGLAGIDSKALWDAYDQYLTEFNDYLLSESPEYMWEEEWQVVVDSQIKFQEIYAAELRAHLESR